MVNGSLALLLASLCAASCLPHPDADAAARAERSATNLSQLVGTARKLQLYITHMHLQLLPDGTVNGTADDASDYTIFQRSSVNKGQLRIQGLTTCLFLCMDSCGLLYGSKEFTEDCVFNEMIEDNQYNTYSSARYSNAVRTLYVALNRRGQPRKVLVRRGAALGRMAEYTRVLTKWVPAERVGHAVERALAAAAPDGRLRHPGTRLLCAAAPQRPLPLAGQTDDAGRDKARCRRRKKRKKKKRRCDADAAACEPGFRCDQGACVPAKTDDAEAKGRSKNKKSRKRGGGASAVFKDLPERVSKDRNVDGKISVTAEGPRNQRGGGRRGRRPERRGRVTMTSETVAPASAPTALPGISDGRTVTVD